MHQILTRGSKRIDAGCTEDDRPKAWLEPLAEKFAMTLRSEEPTFTAREEAPRSYEKAPLKFALTSTPARTVM